MCAKCCYCDFKGACESVGKKCETDIKTLNFLSTHLCVGSMVCCLFHYCVSEEWFFQKYIVYLSTWCDTLRALVL